MKEVKSIILCSIDTVKGFSILVTDGVSYDICEDILFIFHRENICIIYNYYYDYWLIKMYCKLNFTSLSNKNA